MSIIKEFREFAVKGNMLDLAIGVVIGGAFGKIVSSVVNDIIMPPIGVLISGVNFTDIKILLKQAYVNAAGKAIPAVNLNIGNFIQSLIDFGIIALTIFIVIKAINSFRKKKEDEPVPEPTQTELLLTEIRDLLKNKGDKMKKLLLLVFVFSSLNLYSQTADTNHYWKSGGLASVNISQVSLTNWAAGGESSVALGFLSNLFGNYAKDNLNWDNTLDIGYGLLQTGENPMRKSDDKIELSSKLGYKTSKEWFYSVLLNVKTQMSKGYNYPNDSTMVSNLLAPAYIILSTGMDYKPQDNFSVYISPLSGRVTIVNDEKLADGGNFGVEPAKYDSNKVLTEHGKKVRYEFGAFFKCRMLLNLMENISLTSKLDLFSNYLSNPQNVDVNWDLLLTMKVNKLIDVNISATLVYDDDVKLPIYQTINGVKTQTGTGPRTQFKEVLAIGLSYKF